MPNKYVFEVLVLVKSSNCRTGFKQVYDYGVLGPIG